MLPILCSFFLTSNKKSSRRRNESIVKFNIELLSISSDFTIDHCSMFMFLISSICKTEVNPAYFQYLSMHFPTLFDHKRGEGGGRKGCNNLYNFCYFSLLLLPRDYKCAKVDQQTELGTYDGKNERQSTKRESTTNTRQPTPDNRHWQPGYSGTRQSTVSIRQLTTDSKQIQPSDTPDNQKQQPTGRNKARQGWKQGPLLQRSQPKILLRTAVVNSFFKFDTNLKPTTTDRPPSIILYFFHR